MFAAKILSTKWLNSSWELGQNRKNSLNRNKNVQGKGVMQPVEENRRVVKTMCLIEVFTSVAQQLALLCPGHE